MQFPPAFRCAAVALGLLVQSAAAADATEPVAEIVRSLGLDEKTGKALSARLAEHPDLPDGAVESLDSEAGRKAVRDFLSSHGFGEAEFGWLGKLPTEAPAEARARVILFRAGQLLEQGPQAVRNQWPEWNKGDTPGEEVPFEMPADSGTAALLQPFVPQNPVYRILHREFTDLRGNLDQRKQEFVSLPPIPDDGIVKPGEPYAGAETLARRLVEGGYLEKLPEAAASEESEPLFTEELSAAVKRYQREYGRADDGILGPKTLAEFNRGPEQQLEILRLNLHRARMLPDGPGQRFILVNIPSARVVGFSGGGEKPAVDMRTIVGKAVTERQTPVFRDVMRTVEFGPYWNVPAGIAKDEIVPKARENSGYLEREGFEIVREFGADDALPATAANLSRVADGDLFIRQKPGPRNALGRVKFLFRNDYAIYLHDTPADQLFSEAERDFSHGCIRLEDPAAFAGYVLGPQGWDAGRISTALESGDHETVEVEAPVNVYIVYLTAFPTWSEDGRAVDFEPDVYEKDAELTGRAEK